MDARQILHKASLLNFLRVFLFVIRSVFCSIVIVGGVDVEVEMWTINRGVSGDVPVLVSRKKLGHWKT